jgi:hypothetical protein
MESPYAIIPFSKGTSSYRIKRYMDRAEDLRTIASEICDPDCREILLGLATSYEHMAEADQCRATAAAIH